MDSFPYPHQAYREAPLRSAPLEVLNGIHTHIPFSMLPIAIIALPPRLLPNL